MTPSERDERLKAIHEESQVLRLTLMAIQVADVPDDVALTALEGLRDKIQTLLEQVVDHSLEAGVDPGLIAAAVRRGRARGEQ